MSTSQLREKKKFQNNLKLLLVLGNGILALFVIALAGILVGKKLQEKEDAVQCNVIQTIVIDKYIVDGYAGGGWYIWYIQPTQYVVVSEDNAGGRWTSYMYIEDYNAYDVGSILEICIEHNAPLIYDTHHK